MACWCGSIELPVPSLSSTNVLTRTYLVVYQKLFLSDVAVSNGHVALLPTSPHPFEGLTDHYNDSDVVGFPRWNISFVVSLRGARVPWFTFGTFTWPRTEVLEIGMRGAP